MKKALAFIIVSSIWFNTFSQDSTIYVFSVDSIIPGHTIDFSDFQNKKVLIINTATMDVNSSQLQELKRLQNLYSQNLVVVLFPSNDFNTEPGNNNSISGFLSNLNISFVVAGKISVLGNNIHPLYSWLGRQSLAGNPDLRVKVPFQKYLIDETGHVIKMFGAGTRPMAQEIIDAIND
jgi:glutathione peroxidase